jgi:hypothetical protein
MRTLQGIAASLVMVATSLASAQVLPTQDGRSLDSSFRVGSGGLNSIRAAERINDMNYLVNNQVTGLYGFHGNVGYAPADALRLTLPSAQLDDFNRRAVGRSRVQSGEIYGPNTYFAPSRTVVNVADIAEGLNAPGTNMPRTPYVPPQTTRLLYQSALASYAPVMTPELGQASRVNPVLAFTPLGQAVTAEPDLGLSATPTSQLPTPQRPIASPLFGVMRPTEQERLTAELTQQLAQQQGMILPLEGQMPGEPTAAQPQGQPAQPIPGGAGQNLQPPGQAQSGQPGQAQPAQPGQAQPGQPPQAGLPAGPLPRPGQDVFLDVLVGLNQMRQREQAQQANAPGARPGEGLNTPRGPAGPNEPTAAISPTAAPRQAGPGAPGLVEQQATQLVIHGLAGHNRDQFNTAMARAEEALKAGKFYQAADEYDLACSLNRENPLCQLGGALARFGADEPLGAALYLQRAFQRFPALMETRVDLAALLGKDVAAGRIKELEETLKRQAEQDVSLVFLATFVRESIGPRDAARAHATLLRRIAAGDKLMEAYGVYVLTGQRPALPATRPVGP